VDARVVSDDTMAASALKMCFPAWTKGTIALLLHIRALAETLREPGPLRHPGWVFGGDEDTEGLRTLLEASMRAIEHHSFVSSHSRFSSGRAPRRS
jgi:hypothetical protein